MIHLYSVMIAWWFDISYFQSCTVCQPHRSCQATPLLPADGVWWGEGGHGGRHWDRNGHPASLTTCWVLALLFVCETQISTHETSQLMWCFVVHGIILVGSLMHHLGAGLWDWAERFCAAPPDMVVGYKDETRCVAGAMEPDSEATACSLCPGSTPLRWERQDILNL